MAKYKVDEIKEEAEKNLANYKGRKGSGKTFNPIDIQRLRTYVYKVLFLCREIKKLQKKLKKYGT
ncbi:hypothetical protein LCGC14_1579600 [marine sediment metagenome]|uniref:Uncharacterized protein n=1 Tax=marine sediment metagenome TaxID=412755 RepID=A0A0F9LHI6_9ZZZZ